MKKLKVGDFLYQDNPNKMFDIIYDENRHPMPQEFFKYYALSENSLSAFRNSYMYASHPAQLNDPFDCDIELIDIDDEFTQRFLVSGIEDIISKENWSPDFIHSFVKEYYRELLYRKIGIVSLTTKPENELMWAHYATNKGFCISFDLSKITFKNYGVFPINYVPDVSQIKTSEVGIRIATAAQCTLKSENWSYEDEWRLIVSNPPGSDFKSFGKNCTVLNKKGSHNRKMAYPLEAINYVILGFRFMEDFLRISGPDNNCFYLERKFNACNLFSSNSLERMEEKMKCLILDFIIDHNLSVKVQEKTRHLGVYLTKRISLQKVSMDVYKIKMLE